MTQSNIAKQVKEIMQLLFLAFLLLRFSGLFLVVIGIYISEAFSAMSRFCEKVFSRV